LVAKGFTPKHGINYFDTYASVARIATIRLLIAIAAIHKLVIHLKGLLYLVKKRKCVDFENLI